MAKSRFQDDANSKQPKPAAARVATRAAIPRARRLNRFAIGADREPTLRLSEHSQAKAHVCEFSEELFADVV
jgi:hypothetical protein